MIRHRLLCLGYFDFGSVGLFNLGFLSLFAAYAQQSQNAAQSSQPTERGRQSPALFLYAFDKNQSKAQKPFRKLKNLVVAPSTFRHGK